MRKVLRAMIKYGEGTDLLERDDDNRTCIHEFLANCHLGHSDFISVLMENPKLANSRDSRGNTPLHVAVGMFRPVGPQWMSEDYASAYTATIQQACVLGEAS